MSDQVGNQNVGFLTSRLNYYHQICTLSVLLGNDKVMLEYQLLFYWIHRLSMPLLCACVISRFILFFTKQYNHLYFRQDLKPTEYQKNSLNDASSGTGEPMLRWSII